MYASQKPVSALQVSDLRRWPVWQYTNALAVDETMVRPVRQVPVKTLAGRIAGVELVLANGAPVWALIGNVDLRDRRMTEHLLTLSVERGGAWFAMARYHDFDAELRGPAALAQFLGLSVDDVFPMTYDLRGIALGDVAVLQGLIQKEAKECLSRAEIITMAVP